MKVYVFGSDVCELDNMAIRVARDLMKELSDVEFVFAGLNEDLDLDKDNVAIMDVVLGLDRVRLISDIDQLKIGRSSTVHDYDLGFQLKYLQKLGRLGCVAIIGVPMAGEVRDWVDDVRGILVNLNTD